MKKLKLNKMWQAGLALSLALVLGACGSQTKDAELYEDKSSSEQAEVVDNSDQAEGQKDQDKKDKDNNEQEASKAEEDKQQDKEKTKEKESEKSKQADSQAGTKEKAAGQTSAATDEHAKAQRAREIIAQVIGIKVSDLDGYTDEQILAAQKAAEDVGGDPGYSYQYLKDHF